MGQLDPIEGGAEVGRLETVEPLDGDVEIAALAIPVVQQLVSAAIDIARRQNDVLMAEQVREDRVDRRHSGIEVPGEVLTGEWTSLEVDDVVGERDRSWIEQPGINLEQQLLALERVLDPL